MIKSKGYEVIRFIDYNNSVKVVNDYCDGRLLYQYIEDDEVTKEEIYKVMSGMLIALENYRAVNNSTRYVCVNPFNVLITNSGEVLLLDDQADSYTSITRKMKSNVMRSNFEDAYVNNCIEKGIGKDMFTFAITIKYIMSKVCERIRFTTYEQNQILRIVSICEGDRRHIYENFNEIRQDLRKIIDKEYKRVQKKTTAVIMGLTLLLVILSFVSVFS